VLFKLEILIMKIFISILSSLCFTALICAAQPQDVKNSQYKSGVIQIKLKEQSGRSLNLPPQARQFGIPAIDKKVSEIKGHSIKRIFPAGSNFEIALTHYGLHLWYEIKFDSTVHVEQALRKFRELEQIELVTPRQIIKAVEPVLNLKMSDSEKSLENARTKANVNDPFFQYQWSYDNTGQSQGTPGADIRLKKAWDIQMGNPDVIVAVIDAGIDITHLDLKNALWKNTKEIPNNGIDDDNNGYADDIHGWDFANNSSTILPGSHGTHVAGTIGAITNNTIGVAGIAGGLGSANGIRLMTLDIFGGLDYGDDEAPAIAMIYAANHGAVISQNSWGIFGGTSQLLEDAINYFIERAGYDNTNANFEKNIQIGPMAGGIVLFASGNDNSSDPNSNYPSRLPQVLSVASTDHHDKKSNFSNFGPWVDIAAPGTEVLSTWPSNNYFTISGTSMACPHVSGVAALIISEYGGEGFTPDQVKQRLLMSADAIDFENPSYIGKLGAGRLNAYHALLPLNDIAPAQITSLEVTQIKFNTVTLQWKATGESGTVGTASRYELRYSTSPIDDSNFNQAIPATPMIRPREAGTTEVFDVKKLEFNTTYYFALKAIDPFRNISPISNIVSASIPAPPDVVFTFQPLSENLTTGENAVRYITVTNNESEPVQIGLSYQTTNKPFHEKRKGRAFQINDRYGLIIEVDAVDGSNIRSVPAKIDGLNVAFRHAFDGHHLYVADKAKIYVLLPETGEVIQEMDFTGMYTFTQSLIQRGKWLYVYATNHPDYQSAGPFSLFEINLETQQIAKKIDDLNYSRIISGGSRGTLLGYNFDGTNPFELNSATGEVVRELSLPKYKDLIAFTESYQAVFIRENEDNTFTALNPDTGEKVYALPLVVDKSSPYVLFQWVWIVADEYSWLNTQVGLTEIKPGESVQLPVYFNGTGLLEGVWEGTVMVHANYSDYPIEEIPVSLSVIGTPSISVSNYRIEIKGAVVDQIYTNQLVVSNLGEDLDISELSVTGDGFSSEQESFQLTYAQSKNIEVTFQSAVIGNFIGQLIISSNDPKRPVIHIDLEAEVLNSPILVSSSSQINETINRNDRLSHSFNIRNEGEADLKFSISFKPTQHPGKEQWKKGRLFISKIINGTYYIIELNPSNGAVIKNIPLPGYINGLAFDGQYLYIKANWDGSYKRINPETGQVVGSFYIDELYYASKIKHSGKYIRAYDWLDNWTYEVDFDEGTIIRKFDGNKLGSFLGSRGTLGKTSSDFFDPTSPQEFWEVDIYTNEETKLYNLPRNPENLIFASAYSEALGSLFQLELNKQAYYQGPPNEPPPGTVTAYDVITGHKLYSFPITGWSYELAADEPGWLTVGKVSGTIAKGESLDIPLYFHTYGSFGGLYGGELTITSNDPAMPLLTIPITLDVINFVTGIDEEKVISRVEHFPNPFTDQLTLRYNLHHKSTVHITLHDALGRKVSDLLLAEQSTGEHQIEVDGSTLQQGLFYYRVLINGQFLGSGKIIRK
jgi:subtilisin family serine protease